jgi:tRNA A-37 threonylcarbamoyl transferase component Bud32
MKITPEIYYKIPNFTNGDILEVDTISLNIADDALDLRFFFKSIDHARDFAHKLNDTIVDAYQKIGNK